MSRMENGGYCIEVSPKRKKELEHKIQVKEQKDEFELVLEQAEAILRQRRML
jgi:hypothetical protein